MPDIVNVAAYRFVPLDRLADLRESLRQETCRLGLQGTILISPEGINLFVAGLRDSVDQFLDWLRQRDEFRDLEVKSSSSEFQPFNRMLVKIKREIISFGVPDIDPARNAAPKITPATLKQWLDEKREITLFDVRNNYEIAVGSFAGALPAEIEHFRHFPRAVERLNLDRKRPVVMFCTGGIRCEKAAPFMLQNGFDQVYHLDGGILNYFEQVGGAHYSGECFVFDKRVALDPSLLESGTTQCYACQSILTPQDVQSPEFRLGQWCPRCFVDPLQLDQRRIDERHRRIAEVTCPLPGSQPYENVRPLNIAAAYDGFRLIEFLSGSHPQIQREEWMRIISLGRIQSNRELLSATDLVRAGQQLVHLIPQTVEPPVNAAIKILFEDEALIVVDKPAPLPVHPCGRFNRNSLVHILNLVYHPIYPRPQHRLDANTTGIVALAKSRRIAAQLQSQFELHQVHKSYLARIVGHPRWDEFVFDQPISVRPVDHGRRIPDPAGVACQTNVRVLARLENGESLLAVFPITGRTNQIRIHLWDAKHPIVGDPIYGLADHDGICQTLLPGDPPLCLHHWKMQFRHPLSGADVTFHTDLPSWMGGCIPALQIVAVSKADPCTVSRDTLANRFNAD